ncbi:hypothetical protein NJB1907f44_48210 [Mycobacterium marinum]|nr:hypothetical protein MMRN_17710 [Mycobacterium marinum]GJN95996.1 hypothetical protein NJB1808e29_09670 [Mycobacterium marinum]GJO03663.1 hypothetical protein NJB1907E90_10770 [Mycobacterium marinum]GJO04244.1 hypothetical protein NJB1907f34b_25450 [Mycobacterium marinum]GJO13049.1 hypothetical protein NJB1907E11_07470 [Mycobacterium marinum]
MASADAWKMVGWLPRIRPAAATVVQIRQQGYHVQLVAGHVGLADRAPGFPFTAAYLGGCRDPAVAEPDDGYRMIVVQQDEARRGLSSDSRE